ncbi:MAG: copper chaperone PCu(A)C [Pseudomonadota bacterium]
MIRISRTATLPLLLLALPACQQSPQPDQTGANTADTQSAAAPDAKPGLSAKDGRFALPAVKGNPGAGYFTLANGSDKAVVIAAVDVAGAGMAMLHQTKTTGGTASMEMMENAQVLPGATLDFAPGGNHVMVDGVPADWKPGASVEMTLTFADGDKLTVPLTVVTPGGGG